MRNAALAALVLVLSPACIRKQVVAHGVAASPAPSEWRPKSSGKAVPPFERQVRNAIDAGEGDYRIQRLRDVLAKNPADLDARLEIASYYEEDGFGDVALEHYRLAAERFPESPAAQMRLARSLRRSGQKAAAASGLEKFLASHPGQSAEMLSWMGILADETGDLKKGEPYHRQAAALAPARTEFLNNLGYNLLQQGDKKGAEAQFRQALGLAPNDLTARNNLAAALAGQPEAALDSLKPTGRPAAVHNNLAVLLLEQGRNDEAKKELEIALSHDRNYSPALANLRLLDQNGGELHLDRPRNWWQRWPGKFASAVTGTGSNAGAGSGAAR